MILILHNTRSAYNVGSILRSADGASVDLIYFCGYTPLPDNPKVLKTSLGAEGSVKWKHFQQISKLIIKLKKENYTILALERTKKSKNIFAFKVTHPLALIIGNEVDGIPNSVLKKVDAILEIPMRGKKESLNVAVATGIALYALIKK